MVFSNRAFEASPAVKGIDLLEEVVSGMEGEGADEAAAAVVLEGAGGVAVVVATMVDLFCGVR